MLGSSSPQKVSVGTFWGTPKKLTQCGFRLAVRKGTKQATSTTFCNALQNCAKSAVFAQCHSERSEESHPFIVMLTTAESLS